MNRETWPWNCWWCASCDAGLQHIRFQGDNAQIVTEVPSLHTLAVHSDQEKGKKVPDTDCCWIKAENSDKADLVPFCLQLSIQPRWCMRLILCRQAVTNLLGYLTGGRLGSELGGGSCHIKATQWKKRRPLCPFGLSEVAVSQKKQCTSALSLQIQTG